MIKYLYLPLMISFMTSNVLFASDVPDSLEPQKQQLNTLEEQFALVMLRRDELSMKSCHGYCKAECGCNIAHERIDETLRMRNLLHQIASLREQITRNEGPPDLIRQLKQTSTK